MAPLAVLMLDSDVDDPVVEENMVDDGLFVGLFVLDVDAIDDSSCSVLPRSSSKALPSVDHALMLHALVVPANGLTQCHARPYGVPFVSKYKTDDIYKNAWCLRKSPGILCA